MTLPLRYLAIVAMILTLSSCLPGGRPSVPVAVPPSPPSSPSPVTLPTRPITVALSKPDPALRQDVEAFLAAAEAVGALRNTQGVWIQSDTQLLANYQGTIPRSAASLTKVATSLAALQALGPDYRYTTRVGITGPVKQGVLQGDLVIQGGQDPFFVWEDAITLANLLQQQGIQQVKGNLILLGPFYMNFETDAQTVGAFLKQSLDAARWPTEALQQYSTLPTTTPKPSLGLTGTVTITPPAKVQWLFQRRSLPLSNLLKKMNRYSNNPMADMIANSIGGPQQVTQRVIAATGIPTAEIQLVNGSGLAVENRMSPRAVCALFLAIEKLLQPRNQTIADIFTVMGRDESVLDERPLPQQAVLKSGTLDTVSALGGALPTQKAGVVWFVVMNNEGNVETFRQLQEKLLANLEQSLGQATAVPPKLALTPSKTSTLSYEQLWSRL
jgi:serine-type D-Ala-D-Ala carboxypeptidase/endopeptidase (penicillin-binding protein 4)